MTQKYMSKDKRINKYQQYLALLFCMFLAFYARISYAHIELNRENVWALTGGIGYTDFENMYKNEGQSVVERLAFDAMFLKINTLFMGIELGAQNGNTMNLGVNQTTLEELGGAPIQTTVKPILDLLLAIKAPIDLKTQAPIFGVVKGGIAYRSWQFNDRTTINFMSNIAGEVQAGLGISLGEKADLSLVYQGIYGGNPNFQVNLTNETGHISTIPIQNGALLNLSYFVA